MNFTRASVADLPASNKRQRDEYKDPAEKGLRLHVSQYGTKTFYLYKKYQGKPLRIKLGCFPDISVALAKELAQKEKGKLALGKFESAPREKEPINEISLGELAEEYYEIRRLKWNTERVYRNGVENHLSDWKTKPMCSITKDMIIKRHDHISKESGDSMADSVMRTLRTFFEFYRDHYNDNGDNPVRTLSANRLWKTGIKNRRTRHIPKKELSDWIGTFEQLEHETWRDYLMFVLATGLRKEEAAQLEWARVDFAENMFWISETKNGKKLFLPMNTITQEVLERRRSNHRWVFPSIRDNEKSLNVPAIWRNIRRNIKKELSTHDLRRTFLTLAAGLGVDKLTRKRLVNHSAGSDVTEGYIIQEVEELREPSERIAQLILKEIVNYN